MVFHCGTSAWQYAKMSAISRSDGFGGKMYVPRAMYSFEHVVLDRAGQLGRPARPAPRATSW